MLTIIVVVWVLSAIFSYSFFYLNILPGINVYYLFLLVCICYTLFHLLLNKGSLNWRKYGGGEFERYFKFFVFWSSLFIIISLINLPETFGIKNLMFDPAYILRHASFLPSLAIMFCIYLCTEKKSLIEKLNRYLIFYLLMFLLIVGLMFGKDNIVYTQLIVMLASLFFVKKKTYFALLILVYFVLFENISMSSFIIAGLLIIFILLFGRRFTIFFSREFNLKSIIIFSFSIVLIIIFNKFLLMLISSDANSLWRLNVWENEIRNLIQTYGFGVGFGTAYVDNHIFYEVDNSNMYESFSDLFVIANHNTVINMFYRLGIVGGVGFILMNIALVKWYAKTYLINTEYNRYLMWAFANYVYNFIIISLNPGLESPRFSYGYLISIGFLIGFIIKSRKLSDEKELKT